MRRLSIVMPYYLNPGMLAEQYQVWRAYPEALKARIEIVLVDDGSPRDHAVDVERPDGLPPLRIYRVLVDKPWNQHGARNLGAKVAKGPWLLLTDMDHVLRAESLDRLMTRKNGGKIFTFHRVDAPDLEPTRRPNGTLKAHPNSFALRKSLYWLIGGYDERFCGIYGTDGQFIARARRAASFEHLAEVPLIRYPRTVIPDASTTTLPRKEGRGNDKRWLLAKIAVEGSQDRIETLTFPWKRVL